MSPASCLASLLLFTSVACNAQTSNLFEVCLVGAPLWTHPGSNEWSRVKLQYPPAISDGDLVAVDITNHIMEVREDVFKRLPAASTDGTPFILVAGGERIFYGKFWTSTSSSSAWTPTILVDRVPGKNYLFFERRGNPKNDSWSDPRILRALRKLNKLGPVEYR